MINDQWVMPLANAANDCYVTGAIPWYENPGKTCHVFKSYIEGMPCYAFEGTQSLREWLIDFTALEVPFVQHPQAGPVHLGFWLNIASAVDAIAADLAAASWPSFFVTGHSKGAGEAVLTCLELTVRGHAPITTIAFEPPCVGTNLLTAYMESNKVVIGWTKTRNSTGADIITQVPDWPEWGHQGTEMMLVVPDNYGLMEKHIMPHVLDALQLMH